MTSIANSFDFEGFTSIDTQQKKTNKLTKRSSSKKCEEEFAPYFGQLISDYTIRCGIKFDIAQSLIGESKSDYTHRRQSAVASAVRKFVLRRSEHFEDFRSTWVDNDPTVLYVAPSSSPVDAPVKVVVDAPVKVAVKKVATAGNPFASLNDSSLVDDPPLPTKSSLKRAAKNLAIARSIKAAEMLSEEITE